jgi:hypothetical protein
MQGRLSEFGRAEWAAGRRAGSVIGSSLRPVVHDEKVGLHTSISDRGKVGELTLVEFDELAARHFLNLFSRGFAFVSRPRGEYHHGTHSS